MAVLLLPGLALCQATTYSYDTTGRLTAVNYGAGGSIQYVYDNNGNLLQRLVQTSQIPAKPTGIKATDGTFSDKVRVIFNAVEGATVYRVFRCTTAGQSCGSAIGFPKTTSFDDKKGDTGVVYYYRVRACNADGCGVFSSANTGFRKTEPAKPTGIMATDGTFADRVRVTFNTVAGATVYRVFRCISAGQTCGSPIGFPKVGSFDDTKGNPGTVYYYRVRACTSTTCGKFSSANTGFSSTDPVAPAKPTGIKATDGTFPDKVRVTFNTVTGATVYRVFRCLTTGQTCGSPIGFPKAGTFDDKKGVSGTVYFYRVRACTTTTCSLFSANNAGHRGTKTVVEADAGSHALLAEPEIIPTVTAFGLMLLSMGIILLVLFDRRPGKVRSVNVLLLMILLGSSGSVKALTVCAVGCDLETIPSGGYFGAVVLVYPGTYKQSNISVVGGTLVALDPDPAKTTIDAENAASTGGVLLSVFRRVEDSKIKGFTIRGGAAGINTGGSGAVTLENLIIEDNENFDSTQGHQGGITGSAKDLTIINTVVRRNKGSKGVGIRFLGKVLNIRGSKVEDNPNGGVFIDPGVVAVIEDTIIQNNGGGLTTYSDTTLTNVKILNNASEQGGGIFKDAIADSDAPLNIFGSTISGNTAVRGGGIYLSGGTAKLNSFATVTNNEATGGADSGGGLYCTSPGNAAVAANSISGNNPDNISTRCGTTGKPKAPPVDRKTTADHLTSGTNLDPINTYTGELFSRKPMDLSLGGPMPLFFQRYYASFLKRSSIEGDLGANWRHNFDASLIWNGGDITYTSQDGRATEFVKGAVWVQQNNTDTPYQIRAESGQDVTLFDPQFDLFYTFDFTSLNNSVTGKLIKVEDGHGNEHTISYNNLNGRIQSVSDGVGRILTFSYNNNATPKISGVSDGTRSVTFQYTDPVDPDYLTVVTDPRGGVSTYQYADTSSNTDHALMLSMMRPEANTPFSQTFYDTTTPLNSGRVATQTDANGNTYSLAFSGADTTITDPLGEKRVHSHTTTGELSSSQDAAGASIVIGSDASGRRNSVTDRMGDVTSKSYDVASGKLQSVTNADGSSAGNSYTERVVGDLSVFDLTGVTHLDNSTESFVYDANGNPISHTNRAGNISSATFNSNGQALTATNAAGGISTNTYNADATLASASDPAGNTTMFAYDPFRRPGLVTFADASTHSMSFDDADNLLSSTDENGNTLTMTYDANGNPATFQDALLNTTSFVYDGNDRLLGSTDPLGGVSSHSFDQLGRVATTTNPNGNTTMLGFDIHNRLTSVTDPLLNVWTNTYDPEGIISSRTDPLGNTTTFVSNVVGQLVQFTSPMSITRSVTYDVMGRLESVEDALNRSSTMSRDIRGLMTAVTLPGGISSGYAHDSLGNITAITDPNGKDWIRGYDNMGRVTSETDPLANSSSLVYDNRNRPASVVFPGGLGSLTMSYDLVGNLTRSSYSDGTVFDFSYDANNRLTEADGVSLGYDANGRITASNGITIVRDAGGRITSMTLAANKTVGYTYDANDHLTRINDWAGGITTFSYDAAGKLTGIQRPNGVNTIRIYDNDSRLSELSEGSISTINLTRNANGQVTAATRDVPQAASAVSLESFTNSVDAASQLNGSSYDAMGRTTAQGSRSYVWNLASQLTRSTLSGTVTRATFSALGERLSRTTGGVTRQYIWNYALGITSISVEKKAGNNLRYYVHTPGGSLVYSIDAATNGRSFYHYDDTGNTIFVTGDAGGIKASYAYSPYGKRTGGSGKLDNPFAWQGQYGVMDEGEGLYYVRARYYNADTGRFISRDPIKSINPKEINPYQYALGNPLRFADVTGREGEEFELIEPTPSELTLARRNVIDHEIDFILNVVKYGRLTKFDLFRPQRVTMQDIINQGLKVEKVNRKYKAATIYLEKLEAEYDAWASNRLFAVGFPGAFTKVTENQGPAGLKYKDPSDVDFGPVIKSTNSTFADFSTALILTELLEQFRQFLFYLGVPSEPIFQKWKSSRDAVEDPTNGDKIKSVIPELTPFIVLD